MSNWYYYGKTGEKVGPVSATSLKELARQGLITPETVVETAEGKTATAGKVNGLTFPLTPQPEALTDAAIYGLDAGFGFPDLVSEDPTLNSHDPFANAVASPDVPTTLSKYNAISNKTAGTAYQTKRKPVLLDWLLLDFRFRFFLTPLFLKIIWCAWVVLIEFLILALVLGLLFTGITSVSPDASESVATGMWDGPPASKGGGMGFVVFALTRLLPLIAVPLFVATFLLCIRIALESVMIVFRIGEHLKSIDEKT